MKYTVHTTVTYSTEFDTVELKKIGVTTKKKLLEYAKQNYDETNVTDRNATIYDQHDDTPNPIRRGIGSY
jgi:hypothetical protein